MKLHPDVLEDLLVLYQSGEASAATRELVDRQRLRVTLFDQVQNRGNASLIATARWAVRTHIARRESEGFARNGKRQLFPVHAVHHRALHLSSRNQRQNRQKRWKAIDVEFAAARSWNAAGDVLEALR